MSDDDNALVQVADIEIVKSVLSDLPVVSGGVAEFTIKVTNIGEVELRQSVVTDVLVASCARSVEQVRLEKNQHGDNVEFRFTPGEWFLYTCEVEVPDIGFENTAIAKALYDGDLYMDDDKATVNAPT